jgi:hypothetical protein
MNYSDKKKIYACCDHPLASSPTRGETTLEVVVGNAAVAAGIVQFPEKFRARYEDNPAVRVCVPAKLNTFKQVLY